jgi:hypothetical protein
MQDSDAGIEFIKKELNDLPDLFEPRIVLKTCYRLRALATAFA